MSPDYGVSNYHRDRKNRMAVLNTFIFMTEEPINWQSLKEQNDRSTSNSYLIMGVLQIL
jgi:hypothetical protein